MLTAIYIRKDNNFAIFTSSFIMFLIMFIVLLVSIGISFLFNTIVRELAHLIFGILASYEFSSFRVLDYLFIKKNGEIILERSEMPDLPGQGLMTPKDEDKGLGSALLYNLGGGLLNIIASLVLMFIHQKIIVQTSFSLFSKAIYTIGFYIAIINQIPMRIGEEFNDGLPLPYVSW